MSDRKENEYWLTLTYDDEKFEVNGLDAKECKVISDRQLRNLLVSLRDKARRERWQYSIVLCPSVKDSLTGKAKRLHTHVYIKANPGSTICKYIDQYWGKRYGLVEFGTISGGVQGTGNYLAYMKDQALLTKSQSEGILESCHPQETVISRYSKDFHTVKSLLLYTLCIKSLSGILWRKKTV